MQQHIIYWKHYEVILYRRPTIAGLVPVSVRNEVMILIGNGTVLK